MNTNALKKFAQEARTKLISQVGAKLEYVLTSDSAELREKSGHVKKLQEAINNTSKEQVIDKVAYTWFNRLMALRYMDANDYQPLGIRVITPKDGYTLPELLDEAKQGSIPDDLPVKTQRVYDLLDGKTPSSNPQNEAFKELLIGACNHLNKVFPFLFERISGYTELLLPDDLTSEFSIVQDVRDGMTMQDCSEVEIIGWIYQFYISEKKDAVFASKSKVKKEDIPAATQLFTPRWIVEYMVQNTVGKLWLQNKPNSKLREHMPYFIESPSVESEDYLKVDSVEEITLLDQACGSGHILVYGFELFTKIYEEEGYNPTEIPQLIIGKNLFGFEIDERAAQLAELALMMKARSFQRRIFRKELKPNILCYQDLKLTMDEVKDSLSRINIKPSDELLHDLKNMQQATNLGSLICPHSEISEIEDAFVRTSQKEAETNDVFLKLYLGDLRTSLGTLKSLADKYHCVVDNPPYMGGGKMNKPLSDFVKLNYPASKSDLMACFMEAGLMVLHEKGALGIINQHSWMFLSSYEKLRENLIKDVSIDTLLHLGPRTFPEIGGEVVQNASFTLLKSQSKYKGVYVRLVDYNKSSLKRTKALEAIQNKNCGWLYNTDQNDFLKIPGCPIGFWLSKKMISTFELGSTIGEIAAPRQGLASSNNARFLREWFETPYNGISFDSKSRKESLESGCKWFPYNKGGSFRKWYGNNEFVINWNNDGEELLDFASSLYGSPTRTIKNIKHYFKPAITWSALSSGGISLRKNPPGFLFDTKGQCIFSDDDGMLFKLMAILNSKVAAALMKVLAPTLDFNSGVVAKVPFIENLAINLNEVESCFDISKEDWNVHETAWGFLKNELIRLKGQDLEESFELFKYYWTNKFFQLHKNEEELNRHLIHLYGLQDELTPDVYLEEITVLKDETRIENGQLVFNQEEVFCQFISYAVGCMFGRYSLDKVGLVLANHEETVEDFLGRISKSEEEIQFHPDDDNIIPILDDEWFEDDIVGRFYEFLKITFGKENFDKNLAFVEDCIGKDIRKFFVKDFYADHIKRYSKRPIYWMFSSPKGSFNVLIYMHRYTPDTLNQILNDYLKEYREKLNTKMEHLDHLIESGASSEQTKAAKEKDKLKLVLLELQEYEREVLYPLATKRISIDLDDGVLINYNKFGKAIKEVKGLNDKKTKGKVQTFDWINAEEII